MPEKDFQKGITQLDKQLLERLIKQTTSATDRTGARVMYQVPLEEKYTDVCQHIFAKHGIGMEKYQSSLNPFPVLKIKLSEIDKLSSDSREFLFAINVRPDKLQKHLDAILAEMRAHNK